jgi:hypothetical protein
MPKLGLGLSLPQTRITSAPLIPISGLSLWLKADAGITTTPFISQIVVSGATNTPSSNGTYTRETGAGDTFTGPNGNTIYWDGEWYLYDDDDSVDTDTYRLDNYDFTGVWTALNGALPVPTSITTTTLLVTGWADQSGNGINASPVDVYPTYNPSDLNGKPTISLSSVASESNKSFELSGNPMGASGATAFVVNYVDPAVFPVEEGAPGNANGALLGNFGDATNGSHWPYGVYYPATVYDAFATSTRKDNLGEPNGIISWNIYSVYSQDDDWKLFCNGIEVAADTENIYSNAIANSTSLYIGMQNNAGSDQLFKGKVAEVVIYNRVLTTPERLQVELYLNLKYEIYG